jgi:hypothetical protein
MSSLLIHAVGVGLVALIAVVAVLVFVFGRRDGDDRREE